jgi:hypothetical protein
LKGTETHDLAHAQETIKLTIKSQMSFHIIVTYFNVFNKLIDHTVGF